MTNSTIASSVVLIAALLATVCGELNAQQGPVLQLGPMLGHVGPDEARIWVRATSEGKLSVRIGENEDLRNAIEVTGLELKDSAACMGSIRIPNLNPSTTYYYSVLLDGNPTTCRPHFSFETSPPDGRPAHFRVAFSSCFGKDNYSSAAGWAELAARGKADLMLQLGDNHYADTTDPIKQRSAYFAQRDLPGFRATTSGIPNYGIWDDHDFGPDNSDRLADGKKNSLLTFKQHWANPGYGEAENPGIYFTFSRGDVQFIMLDDRYYRDPNNAEPSTKKTLLGKRQKAWLKEQLLRSTAKLIFVASGSEFHPNSHVDSWASFDHERQEIFEFLKEHKLTNVILLSGDRHFTGGYQINGQVIEITSGPMGSKTYPTKNLPDMFFNLGEGKMFAVFDVDTTGDKPKVSLEVYQVGMEDFFKREFSWDEITGRTRISPLAKPK